jgi:TolB-like protein/DNA-binding winged helix-turn-helix (wHTH) protein/Flp pilus assembly protein TadD
MSISRGQETVHLEPKVMDVLVKLASRPGEVVTRDEFMTEVWRGRVVTDESLSRCVSLLRLALGDSQRSPEFVQTVPKVGYRLVAPTGPIEQAEARPVAAEAQSPADGETGTVVGAVVETERGRRTGPFGLGAGFLTGIAALAAVLWALGVFRESAPDYSGSSGLAARGPSLAVLPLVNVGGDAGDDYFSDGLTEELINSFSRVEGLAVVARTSAFAYKKRTEDIREIGRRLGARHVLDGSVRRSGQALRINVQLIDAETGTQVWAEQYAGHLDDVFVLQAQITRSIVDVISPRLTPATVPALARAMEPMANTTAFELVLRGRHQLRRRNAESLERAIGLFRRAIDAEPDYGSAYLDLAKAIALQPFYTAVPATAAFAEARGLIEDGVRANPSVESEAQGLLAFLSFQGWDWVAAENGFRRALLAAPNDPELHQWYSQLLASLGHLDQSLAHARRARELDALSPVANDRLAVACLWVDQDEAARQQFAVAEELGFSSDANPGVRILLMLRSGENDAAASALEARQRMAGRGAGWVRPFIQGLSDPASRAAAIDALNDSVVAGDLGARYRFGASVLLGDADGAMDLAFPMISEPGAFDLEFLFSREAASFRRHPRFPELVHAIGLDEHWRSYGWPSACSPSGSTFHCT